MIIKNIRREKYLLLYLARYVILSILNITNGGLVIAFKDTASLGESGLVTGRYK